MNYYTYVRGVTMSKSVLNYTVALIKPDAYEFRKSIIRTILAHQLIVVSAKDLVLDEKTARLFYAEHEQAPHFKRLVQHMASGRILAMQIADPVSNHPVKKWRDIIGPTDPQIAASTHPRSIRAEYGAELPYNAVHGSDSYEAAICESGVLHL